MRVGIFTDTYRPQVNGVVSSILTLEKELRKKGHKVYIITTTDPDAPMVEPNVLRLPSMEFKPLPQYRLGMLYSSRIIKKIKRLELDIIHSQTEWGVGTFARFAAINLEIPLVHTYHTLYEYYTHYITRGHFTVPAKKLAAAISKFYCEKCNALIVPTRKVEDILYSYDVDKNMNIIPTGIELNKFYRENYTDEEIKFMRESFNIQDSDFLCVYIGRIAKEKSIDVLIDMFSKIKDETFKFMIVGRGPVVDELKNQAENLGISDRVIFAGEVPHDKVPVYYQMGDVFLNASVSETQGLTFVEAMAAKTPVNARYDLNLEDLLVKNEAGLVYKNEEEFISNIMLLKQNKKLREKIIENAYNVSQDFTAEKFGERVEAVYKKTIEEYDSRESFTIFRGEKYIQQIRRWTSIKSSGRSPWSK
ncbi:glycosyltransferase [Pseudoleptotrichia goodfellowii]|uniref:Glycosyltransferase, group 1 family protein n=1 Tax=Pseudoleptotrichia goodfellowii F0264 TaxID=596323 RepID=D0GPC8_9FUSO|nr:glycosyltransferase [Pseudoleptotrichia goodfellowii]EEY34052.1 glycosyltransferase, group 1 family protein [Pseudoleptotrichia goodfellowii F0264]MBF4806336.1 glycosyltransferase [Pseudoleptotrichia goodfellowii]